MSAAHPGDREVQAARDLLRALSSARQVYALYPAVHPKRTETVTQLRDLALRLREETVSDPVLFVSGGNFYLGPMLLAWESLTLYRLAEALGEAGVQSLEFLPNPADPDMDGLVRLIVGESLSTQLGAVAVNRAGPVTAADAIARGLGELLKSYAVGLDLLRETAARLLSGRPADLDATVRLTGHLADLIASDPAQALLLTTVKSYDEYTFHHMVNVCILALAVARAVGLSREQSVELGIGGLLHDVGKVKVPQEILTHDGALDEEQWRLIQRHPVDGAGLVLITSRNAYHPAVATVLEHHAAYDGSGYPTLSGRRVPALASRIVSVVDCFDAMTSKRSYRKPEERRQALNILQAGAGGPSIRGWSVPFVRLVGLFPVGSLVQLTTGEVAVVVRNHERSARTTHRAAADRRSRERVRVGGARPRGAGPRRGVPLVRATERRPRGGRVDMLSLLASGQAGRPTPARRRPGSHPRAGARERSRPRATWRLARRAPIGPRGTADRRGSGPGLAATGEARGPAQAWATTLGAVPVEIDIEHVARLARLDLTDEEKERLRAQLGLILEHAAQGGRGRGGRRPADGLGRSLARTCCVPTSRGRRSRPSDALANAPAGRGRALPRPADRGGRVTELCDLTASELAGACALARPRAPRSPSRACDGSTASTTASPPS